MLGCQARKVGYELGLLHHAHSSLQHSYQSTITFLHSSIGIFFSLCTGGLLAATLMVWLQENRGWNLSFMISAFVLAFALCIFTLPFSFYRYKCPAGSPLTRIIKLVTGKPHITMTGAISGEQSHDKFKFLNKTLVDERTDVSQVEETKALLGLIPIFGTTIMMNCYLAQLQTFTVEQGSIMNRKLDKKLVISPSKFDFVVKQYFGIKLCYLCSWSSFTVISHSCFLRKCSVQYSILGQEQEEILKTRQQDQKALNLKEIKKMVFLAKSSRFLLALAWYRFQLKDDTLMGNYTLQLVLASTNEANLACSILWS
ncbi:protein NRT1/ PTR FAMILY 4.2-like [Senna tora]|uniref:Protein NRT1/ PTR FAMILY 4.2-like n=1 Tax=Senna tora TaxID=362788 RepID=A0A834THL2_9FABA|nr:protein NRT1/ PTR FAMILY 4.2-like [Senna tora]